jgi:hypothetical protein
MVPVPNITTRGLVMKRTHETTRAGAALVALLGAAALLLAACGGGGDGGAFGQHNGSIGTSDGGSDGGSGGSTDADIAQRAANLAAFCHEVKAAHKSLSVDSLSPFGDIFTTDQLRQWNVVFATMNEHAPEDVQDDLTTLLTAVHQGLSKQTGNIDISGAQRAGDNLDYFAQRKCDEHGNVRPYDPSGDSYTPTPNSDMAP